MEYSVAIRSLGKAGEKYQTLLKSLVNQTIKPKRIIVYIAEGYPLPKETVGCEEYIYVKKGMVAQRALKYDEIDTQYILFLDDDLFLPEDTVEKMFLFLRKEGADVIAPDIMPNHNRDNIGRLMMLISGRMRARKNDSYWGYKVMLNAGYSYNNSPVKNTYVSQTNAGACFLCKKESFLKIRFAEELWLDFLGYPQGEDQVMYYKMYLQGLKQITWYTHNIIHLDAGMNQTSRDKALNLIFADLRLKIIFWKRFIYEPRKKIVYRCCAILAGAYTLSFTFLISLIKMDMQVFKVKWSALVNAIRFIKSDEYRNIPKVKRMI